MHPQPPPPGQKFASATSPLEIKTETANGVENTVQNLSKIISFHCKIKIEIEITTLFKFKEVRGPRLKVFA